MESWSPATPPSPPAPGQRQAWPLAPPPELPELPEGVDPRPRWPWWYGLVAFLAAILVATVFVLLVGAIFAAAGADVEDPPPSLNVIGTLIQDGILVAAAIGFAWITLKPRAWHFGFRRTRFWPALGWAALGLFAYYLFSVFYIAALGIDEEQSTLEDLGVETSTLALVVGGLLVVVVAPVIEEFFFRGFLYRSLRTSLPIWASALIASLVFGVIHAFSGVAAVPPLIVLAIALCLVYERTGSLYPVIAMHVFNNMIAYIALTDPPAVALSLALGLATIAACIVVPRITGRGAPALP